MRGKEYTHKGLAHRALTQGRCFLDRSGMGVVTNTIARLSSVPRLLQFARCDEASTNTPISDKYKSRLRVSRGFVPLSMVGSPSGCPFSSRRRAYPELPIATQRSREILHLRFGLSLGL